MRIFNAKLSGATSYGIFQGNITNLNCLVHQILVYPTSSDTIYSFRIVNPMGQTIFENTGEVGPLAELETLPLLGTYTFRVFNSTKDENFNICLVARED